MDFQYYNFNHIMNFTFINENHVILVWLIVVKLNTFTIYFSLNTTILITIQSIN